jgi:hypothetical protein
MKRKNGECEDFLERKAKLDKNVSTIEKTIFNFRMVLL